MKLDIICDFSIDDNLRPVRLRKVVLGYPCSDNMSEFRFDLSLNYKLSSIIQTYSEQKPTLVVSTCRLEPHFKDYPRNNWLELVKWETCPCWLQLKLVCALIQTL